MKVKSLSCHSDSGGKSYFKVTLVTGEEIVAKFLSTGVCEMIELFSSSHQSLGELTEADLDILLDNHPPNMVHG